MIELSSSTVFPPSTPAPPELIEKALLLVRKHPECFWFRHPGARIRFIEDVRLIVEHLREYGNRKAWNEAQELLKVTFRKARVARGNDSVEIDWAADSAFRFFPIVQDEQLGWKLHLFDMAVNKALALAARTETRDYIDILELCRVYSLAAICWAAPGKDPGYSPLSLLKMMRRFARIDPAKIEEIQARQLDPIAMKEAWMSVSDEAEAAMVRQADDVPDTPIGVAFVDGEGKPGWIGKDPSLRPHLPCLRGCWPTLHWK